MGLDGFVDEVARLLGDRWVLTSDWQLLPYSMDYWPLILYTRLARPREWRRSAPAAVVMPGSEDEVAYVVEAARRHRVTLLAYGGGSGVLGGALPESGWVVVDLSRLDWIEWYDEDAGIVDVGAGVYLAALEEWLKSRGWSLRHYPQSFPEAQIGGLVSTRSTGQYSTGYGGIEERVKGLHAAIPGIGLVKVRPAPRRSLLTPLEQLFTGAEGLFGIITRVYLEAIPLPECEERVSWIEPTFQDAMLHARLLVQKRLAPELFRVYDEYESAALYQEEGSIALGVYEGDCKLVEARVDRAESILEKRISGDPTGIAGKWLEERFDVITKIRSLLSTGLAFDTIEVSSTWGLLRRVYEALRGAALSVEGVYYAGIHAGHFYLSGAALYETVVVDASRLSRILSEVWERVTRAVAEAGGSIAHHHGVGRMRIPYLHLEVGCGGVEVISRIKKALDPEGVLRGPLPAHSACAARK